MPKVPQEPLKELSIDALVHWELNPGEPGPTPPPTHYAGPMQYVAEDTWRYVDPTDGTMFGYSLIWASDEHSAQAYGMAAPPGCSLLAAEGLYTPIPDDYSPYESGLLLVVHPNPFNTYAHIRCYRDVPPVPSLPAAVTSTPGITGTISLDPTRILHHRPIQPAGPAGPITGHTLATRAPYTLTAPRSAGHAARSTRFSLAMTAWGELPEAERTKWERAGRTFRPPQTGREAFLSLAVAQRHDRISTLQNRIQATLTPPP